MSLRIQSEYGKKQTRKTQNKDTFEGVFYNDRSSFAERKRPFQNLKMFYFIKQESVFFS